MSSNKTECTGGNNCCCGTKKKTLVAMSCLFMVAMSYVYGAILALPAAGIVAFFMPGVFESFAQGFLVLTFAFSLIFLSITALSRLFHASLEGGAYLRQTFYYDFLGQ